MRILFVTTADPRAQGDYLEVSLLHGLREILGSNCVDYPRKKVMYHDWSETPKKELHGNGFTLYKHPIQDLTKKQRELKNFDFVLYGVSNAYGVQEREEINCLVGSENVWHLDGHDLYGFAPRMIENNGERVIGVQKPQTFKRELVEEHLPNVFPTGFGIPEYQIRPIEYSIKDQLYQRTAPDDAVFRTVRDTGGSRSHHKFSVEEEYYHDLSRSWFGLTCKKGGWDCMRHYEIMAAGALLLFKDYNKKNTLCSPQRLPCFSYETSEELHEIMNSLVVNNKPTEKYKDMINKQRGWLLSTGTTRARAQLVIDTLKELKDG